MASYKKERLYPGMYRVEKNGRVYIVSYVDPRDSGNGKSRWNIDEQIVRRCPFTDEDLLSHVAIDATEKLNEALYLIDQWKE